MNDYKTLLAHVNKVVALEAKVETEIDNMLSDFDNNYYFEIDIRTGNHDYQKIIWLSFYLPVINSGSEKEVLEIGFNIDFDLRYCDKACDLQFTEQKSKFNQQQSFLMFMGKDLEQFLNLPKVGNINKQDIKEYLDRCYLSIKMPVDKCSFTDFISQVKKDYVVPFLKNNKFSVYNEMIKPDTTETIEKINEILTLVIESINTRTLVSSEINKLFFNNIVSALQGHEYVAYFKNLNSQLPAKPESGKIKI